MDYEVGQILGRYQQYQIIEKLEASNAWGTSLYRAYDLERQVAVGVYQLLDQLKPHLDLQNFYDRFQPEMQMSDPNRIRIIDVEVGDETHVVTEWIDGISLAHLLDDMRQQTVLPTAADMVEIVQQIGCAL